MLASAHVRTGRSSHTAALYGCDDPADGYARISECQTRGVHAGGQIATVGLNMRFTVRSSRVEGTHLDNLAENIDLAPGVGGRQNGGLKGPLQQARVSFASTISARSVAPIRNGERRLAILTVHDSGFLVDSRPVATLVRSVH